MCCLRPVLFLFMFSTLLECRGHSWAHHINIFWENLYTSLVKCCFCLKKLVNWCGTICFYKHTAKQLSCQNLVNMENVLIRWHSFSCCNAAESCVWNWNDVRPVCFLLGLCTVLVLSFLVLMHSRVCVDIVVNIFGDFFLELCFQWCPTLHFVVWESTCKQLAAVLWINEYYFVNCLHFLCKDRWHKRDHKTVWSCAWMALIDVFNNIEGQF